MEMIKQELMLIKNLGYVKSFIFGYIRMKCERQNNQYTYISYSEIAKILNLTKYRINQEIIHLENLGIINANTEKFPIRKYYIINYSGLNELLNHYNKIKKLGGN